MDAAIDLATWQQAFEEYSISTARAIEKQLRANVTNNREKLRILVGGNYRELLSTAEQIVALDGQTKAAESHISEVGQQCKPPAQQPRSESKEPRKRFIAQLRLLQRCIAVAKSDLSQGSLLQPAQLIVVSRLLVKSLSDEETLIKSLPSMREKATSIRRQLLRRVDTTLTSPHSTTSTMVKASCAYCLLTSASFQDVFKHTHRLRLERLRKSLDHVTLLDGHIVEGLRYHVATLKMLGGLTGRAMIDALGNLQKRPILQEPAIGDLELLDLKGIGALIPEEIQSFIPYFKRTPLSADEVRHALLSWSSDASPVISNGIERLLLEKTDIAEILALRRALYTALLPVYFSAAGSSLIYQTLSQALSKHVEILCRTHVERLRTIAGEAADSSNFTSNQGALWQADLAKTSLNNGASTFLHQIHRRRRGTSPRLTQVSRLLNAWISSTKGLLDAFQELRKVRWRDVLEEPDDDEEENADTLVKGLTKDDPDLYSTQMQSSLQCGFEDFERTMETAVSQSLERKAEVQVAVAYLRTIRELLAPLRKAFTPDASFKKLDELVPRLHQVMAAEIVSQVCISTGESGEVRPQQGGLFIENLPSPRTFGFLRQLCAAMFELGGTDMWSPAAVVVVKSAIAGKVFQEDQKQAYMESTFDEDYLAAALQPSVARTLDKLSEQGTAAREYWNRTRVLFGILSG